MKTKTATALHLMREGKVKEALAIFRTFRIGFDKDERRTIQIASESMNGMAKFYISLGYNVDQFLAEAIEIINKKYKP
jgi:hypothetical protein